MSVENEELDPLTRVWVENVVRIVQKLGVAGVEKELQAIQATTQGVRRKFGDLQAEVISLLREAEEDDGFGVKIKISCKETRRIALTLLDNPSYYFASIPVSDLGKSRVRILKTLRRENLTFERELCCLEISIATRHRLALAFFRKQKR